MNIKIEAQEGAGLIDVTYKDILVSGVGLRSVVAVSDSGRVQTLGIYKDEETALGVIQLIKRAIETCRQSIDRTLIITMPKEEK